MKVSFEKLKEAQQSVAKQVSTEDAIKPEDIRYIAGFDLAYAGDKVVCAAVVLNFKTMQIVEKKYSISKTAMAYVPGFLAFREGPPIMQTYFDLECEPDILLIDGHGIAHPLRCGLASYVGVELDKPTIGVAKKLLVGEVKDGKIFVEGEERGRVVKTREYAKPVYVSPGHKVSIESAAGIVKKCIVPPHKMPEPLHIAHRLASKILEGLSAGKGKGKEPEELEEKGKND